MKYLLAASCLFLFMHGLYAQQKYDKGSRFLQGYARIENKGQSFYVDQSGKPAFDTIYNNMSLSAYPIEIDTAFLPQDILVVGLKGKMGVMTVLGQWLLQPVYDTIDTQSVEEWRVKKDNKISYYTTKGFIMPFRFEDLENLDDHYFAVQEKGKWGVFYKDKDQLVVPYTYEEIDYCFGCNTKGDYILAKQNGKWGVVNFKNEVLVPFKYDHEHMNLRSDEWIESFYLNDQKMSINLKTKKVDVDTCQCLPLEVEDDLDTELLQFKGQRRNGKWGMANAAGKVILDHLYDDLSYDSSGVIGVMRGDKYGLADTTGKIIVPIAYDSWFKPLCNGLVWGSDQHGLEVIFSKEGKRILPQYHQFDEMKLEGDEKLISYTQGKLYGFYNPVSGKIVPPKYTSLGYYNSPNRIHVSIGSKNGYVDMDGNVIVPVVYDAVAVNDVALGHEELVFVILKDMRGVYDVRQKKLIAPAIYDYISNYPDTSVLTLTKGDKYGLMDFSGKMLVPVKYKNILMLDSVYTLLQATDTSRVEVFNKQRGDIFQIPYDTAGVGHEGRLMRVVSNNKSFLYDVGKRAVIEGAYSKGGYPDQIGYFESHVARVSKDGKVGFIDPKGNYIVPPQFSDATGFHQGVAAVFNVVDSVARTFRYGFMDSTGKVIVNPIFDVPAASVSNFTEDDFFTESGLLVLWKDGHVGYANHDGKQVIPAVYDEVSMNKNGDGYLVKRDNKFGIVDASGREILKPVYDDVLLDEGKSYSNTVVYRFPVLVKKGGHWEYMDEHGKPLGLVVSENIAFSTLDWGESPEPIADPVIVPAPPVQ